MLKRFLLSNIFPFHSILNFSFLPKLHKMHRIQWKVRKSYPTGRILQKVKYIYDGRGSRKTRNDSSVLRLFSSKISENFSTPWSQRSHIPYPVWPFISFKKLRVGASQIKDSVCTERIVPLESTNTIDVSLHNINMNELRNCFALSGLDLAKLYRATMKWIAVYIELQPNIFYRYRERVAFCGQLEFASFGKWTASLVILSLSLLVLERRVLPCFRWESLIILFPMLTKEQL